MGPVGPCPTGVNGERENAVSDQSCHWSETALQSRRATPADDPTWFGHKTAPDLWDQVRGFSY